MIEILWAVLILTVLGFLLGLGLSVAAKVLYVEVILSVVILEPSIDSTLYKTSNPPCKSKPNFRSLNNGTHKKHIPTITRHKNIVVKTTFFLFPFFFMFSPHKY